MAEARSWEGANWIILFTMLALLALAGGIDLTYQRERITRSEHERLLAITKVIATDIARDVQAADVVLRDVRRELLTAPMNAAFNQRLTQLVSGMTGVRTLNVHDVSGVIRATSRPEILGMNAQFDQRDYFRVPRDQGNTDTLYVSPPFTTATGLFSLAYSHVLTDRQGQFSGVVTAIIEPRHYLPLLDASRAQDDMVLAVIHGDGSMVMIAPKERDVLLGHNLDKPKALFREFRQSGQSAVVITGTALTDGRDFMIAHREVSTPGLDTNWPLIVTASRTIDGVYADWHASLRNRLLLLLLVVLMSVGALFYYQRRVRALRLAEAQARGAQVESDRLYRLLAENTYDVIWTLDIKTWRFTYVSPSVLRLRGYTPEELIGQSPLHTLDPESAALLVAEFDAMCVRIEAGERSNLHRVLEQALKHKDGHTIHTELTGSFVLDAEGHPMTVVGITRDITKRKLAEQALAESELFSKSTLDAVSEHLCVLDRTGVVIAVNQAWRAFFLENSAAGTLANFGIGTNYIALCESALGSSADGALALAQGLRRVLAGEVATFALEYPCHSPAEQRWFLARITRFHGDSGNAVIAHQNITEQKLHETRLQLAANVFDHSREGITITDPAGAIIDVNQAFTRITGYTRDEVLGKNPRILKSGWQDAAFYAAMWQQIIRDGYWTGELWNRKKSGEDFPELITISAVRDGSGTTLNYVATFTEITQIKAYQQQLEQLAHYDKLTGLPNRVLKDDRLKQAITQSERRGTLVAVAYLDLDGFKAVNDTHGHEIGDRLLVTVSARLKEALREGDTLARIGGDEFVAILVDIESVEICVPILERLLEAAARPVLMDKITARVSASIGVTIYPLDHAEPDILLRHADQAMYQAKQAGRNQYCLFGAHE